MGLSYTLSFNATSLLCYIVFNSLQNYSSLSSLALEPSKGFYTYLSNKKDLGKNQSLFYGAPDGIFLGFPPRSKSFAIEPTVQVCSIFSLSEFRFAQYVRKSAEPITRLRLVGFCYSYKLLKIKKQITKVICFFMGQVMV